MASNKGQWRRNTLHGKYVYITDSMRAYGSMQNGKLDGYNILWVRPEGKEGAG
jgi:hypothetical protein